MREVLNTACKVGRYLRGVVIPCTLDGDQRSYLPDFLVRAARRRCRRSTGTVASGAGACSRSGICTTTGRDLVAALTIEPLVAL